MVGFFAPYIFGTIVGLVVLSYTNNVWLAVGAGLGLFIFLFLILFAAIEAGDRRWEEQRAKDRRRNR